MPVTSKRSVAVERVIFVPGEHSIVTFAFDTVIAADCVTSAVMRYRVVAAGVAGIAVVVVPSTMIVRPHAPSVVVLAAN